MHVFQCVRGFARGGGGGGTQLRGGNPRVPPFCIKPCTGVRNAHVGVREKIKSIYKLLHNMQKVYFNVPKLECCMQKRYCILMFQS